MPHKIIAEDLVLKYMREVCIVSLQNQSLIVNKGQQTLRREYALYHRIRILLRRGPVDITANLKGAVPKAQVAKILQTLVDKNELTCKIVGK